MGLQAVVLAGFRVEELAMVTAQAATLPSSNGEDV